MSLDRALEFVFSEEKYGNHALPGDPGGLTIWGITARWYPNEVALMSKMPPDVAKGQARMIYYREFWLKAGCDKMLWPLNAVALDTAVNCGLPRLKTFKADDWRDILCARSKWLIYESKSRYLVSLMDRVRRLYELANKEA